MKLRQGFISNSSSCSFTCEVCERNESGYDSVSMREYGFVYCDLYHTLCLDCLLGEFNENDEPQQEDFDTEELWAHAHGEWEDREERGDEDICPSTLCPICQFIEPSQRDMAAYLQKKYKVSKDKVFAEIKKTNKQRKKLYDFEYITYVCKEHNVELTELLPKLKEEFKTYDAFTKFLREG